MMPEHVTNLSHIFSINFMPHGYCYLWIPSLVLLHVISDGIIALAYMLIPFALAYLVYKRKDMPFGWMFFCFCAFIIACGSTHLMEIWNLWHGNYWIGGLVKAVTAIISFVTAVLLIKLAPAIIALPSPAMLRKANKEAESSEEISRRILEATLDAMVMINQQGDIIFANIQTEKIFGYKNEELIGQQIEKLIPERFHNRHPQHRTAYFANPHTRPMGSGMELYGLRKSGEEFPVEISLSPLDTKDGMVALAVVRDVTERKKIDKLKNEFLSIVSHELRTPLTSIKGALDLLTSDVMGELSVDESQELLILAKKNSERLVRLINDILDVEKIASGKMEFQFEPVEITHLLEVAINVNRPYAQSFNVRIKLLQPEQNRIVQADYDRLLQVLSNLISNAIKFSPRGGEITIAANQQGNKVRISVTDKGPGIPEEFQSKIFQKFAQADSSASREHSGTGLGLNISRAIVEKHNGTISFMTSNQGTTFYFDLPIKALESENQLDKENV